MNCKKMTVWSCGNEKAKTAKINAIGHSICFLLLCVFHIITFLCNPYDDKTTPVTLGDHLLFGIMFLGLIGWLTALMFYAAKDSFEHIRKNKQISLYLYKIRDFAKIGEIPNDKFILFSDESGVVLADKQYEDESRYFTSGTKYFYEFEEYYEKHIANKD